MFCFLALSDMGRVTDVSEGYTASMFRVYMLKMAALHFYSMLVNYTRGVKQSVCELLTLFSLLN